MSRLMLRSHRIRQRNATQTNTMQNERRSGAVPPCVVLRVSSVSGPVLDRK